MKYSTSVIKYVTETLESLKQFYNACNICVYRTLRGRDQREKCTLNVVKYTFQVKCTLFNKVHIAQCVLY